MKWRQQYEHFENDDYLLLKMATK